MAYYIYLFLFYLILPFILIRTYKRQLQYKKERGRLKERFGVFALPTLVSPIWIHAVSYGEAVLAEQFVKKIKQENFPNDVIVTTTTFSGSERIQKNLKNEVFHVYLPYDLPLFIKSFLKKTNPSILIVLETELWPTLLRETHKKGILILLANARLSEKSFRHYQYISSFIKKMLSKINLVLAQTEADGERFLKLGLPPSQLLISGNVKFDQKPPEDIFKKAEILRKRLGENRIVWIAASTHDSEEEQILKAFEILKKIHEEVLLILVPRHPERFEKVAALCEKTGYKVVRRSQAKNLTPELDIYLGDTLGDLFLLYAASDFAFVGGSFEKVGGHNVLEPISLEKPTLIGPYFFNFQEIVKKLEKKKGIQVVHTPEVLAKTLIYLFENSSEARLQAQNATLVLSENKGALDKHIESIHLNLPK